jgi:hypothetical protein
VKRHANVRFDNSADRDHLLAELANLVPTGDVLAEDEPKTRSVEAAGAFNQQEGDHDNASGQGAPGSDRDGD